MELPSFLKGKPRSCLSLFDGVRICPEILKRGRTGWKVGTKIYKEVESGLAAKPVVLELAPSFAPCLSWLSGCQTNTLVLLWRSAAGAASGAERGRLISPGESRVHGLGGGAQCPALSASSAQNGHGAATGAGWASSTGWRGKQRIRDGS